MEEPVQRWTTPDGQQVVRATWSPGTIAPHEGVGMLFGAPGIGARPVSTRVEGQIIPPLPAHIRPQFGGWDDDVRVILDNLSSQAIAVPPLTITWMVTDVRIL